jgi:hypothetical protein
MTPGLEDSDDDGVGDVDGVGDWDGLALSLGDGDDGWNVVVEVVVGVDDSRYCSKPSAVSSILLARSGDI